MAGLSSGTPYWDNLPQELGLTVDGGVLKGMWQGMPVQASFEHRYDSESQRYYDYTYLQADFVPPLGVVGIEHGAALKRIVDHQLESELAARVKPLKMSVTRILDKCVFAETLCYASNAPFYTAAFDVLTWAAKIVMERRAQSPPEWERTIAADWPPIAQAWGFRFDARAGYMTGNVGDRPTGVNVVVSEGEVMTGLTVVTTLPTECHMSLAPQKHGFFSKLFRGQDIVVGDRPFDDAFVIKGKPEEFIRAKLTPTVRARILDLSHEDASITLEDGKVTAWVHQLITVRAQLERLMTATQAAVDALCEQ